MGSVLVVGGGIAGLQAATDLVRLGNHRVYLVEKRPHVGGKLHDLERTFPTDDCSLCRLAPEGCFLCIKSPFPPSGFRRLRVLTSTEVIEVTGEPGRYRATVRDGQGNTFSLPQVFSAVILAPGCIEFDPTGMERLKYGRHPNVLTASRYEEMLATGRLNRPSDQGPVTRVAWVQCVGSRDTSLNRPLCSAVCCGYAVKQAATTSQLSGGAIQTTIFAQDLRIPDLPLGRYAREALQKHGIRVIRHRVHSIDLDEQEELHIRFAEEDGTISAEPFDLVVLSVGLEPDPQASRVARTLGLELDEWGFCLWEPHLHSACAARAGVFVTGSFSEPKDVRASLTQASAAALACHAFLCSLEPPPPSEDTHPPVGSAPDAPAPRTAGAGPCEDAHAGVLVCQCPRTPDCGQFVAQLERHVRAWPQVRELAVLRDCPLEGGEDELRPFAARHRKVVLAACSPRACEAALRSTTAVASKSSVRVAQVFATAAEDGRLFPLPLERALGALRASLAPAPSCRDVQPAPPPVRTGSVLIVGGGAAGLSCALALADLGILCHLVEREGSLGGQMLTSGTGALAPHLRRQLQDLADRASSHPLVNVYLRSQVSSARRTPEGWQVTLAPTSPGQPTRGEVTTISCGAVVIAVGGEAAPLVPSLMEPDNEAVITLPELEELIASGIPLGAGGPGMNSVVIVLCTGDNPPGYCSKVCCLQAVRCALALKTTSPNTDVLVLFRDICTPGRAELEYNEARRRGVRFVRLPPGSPPRLQWQETFPDGSRRLALTYLDPVLGEHIALSPGLVAVASGLRPPGGLGYLAATFELPLDEDGFVRLRHAKVRPVETPVPGVFACGSATGPATTGEALAQGMATATRVATFLQERPLPARVARIMGACSACLTCLRVCTAGAIRLEDRKPHIDPCSCQGCGICMAECPAQAIALSSLCIPELEAEVDAALHSDAPQLLVFACSHCAFTAVERSALLFPPGTRVIGVPCVGTVGETLMLRALTLGTRGVVLAGCREGQCHYGSGPERARKRVQRVRNLLAQVGAGQATVEVLELTPDRAPLLSQTLAAMSSAAETKVCAGGK